ncbi:AraC family transcriptional regulator [Methylocapsa sp. S129]|uniref:AraC family transcriptional regulator n=1 Tax=Methylocapsa sp. S129 TaxID=1641869 RepID=UPI00131B921C|nr:AraC family transcriptional regulator [Methylocapsa sp. S129]
MKEDRVAADYCRLVGGELVSSIVAQTMSVRVEMLRRRSSGRIAWRFRQPRLALFWFRHGLGRFRLEIDGSPIRAQISPTSSLGLFPADVGITGEFEVDRCCEYAVAFLDWGVLAARCELEFQRPLVAFSHDPIKQGFAGLCREATEPDNLFDLFAEGWALQTLAQLAQISRTTSPKHAEARGGLPPISLRRVEDYIRANLSNTVTLTDLSEIAGLSPRHFLRAFQDSVGATLLGHVRAMRIDEAKQRLSDRRSSITQVAIECGFRHAQHFATSFRAATGVTPSAFRRLLLS